MVRVTNDREQLDNWIRAAIDLGLDFEVQIDRNGYNWTFTTSGPRISGF